MRTRNRRRGFTLVELLVATTLTIFIMLILTSAFRAGLDAFRLIRATGQMQEKLRAATAIIRRDLTAEHFGPATDSFGGPYLRDQRLDLVGWKPPEMGYFRIWQNLEPEGSIGFTEGTDADGLASTRATGHILQFTARLNQAKQADYFSAVYRRPTGNGPTGSLPANSVHLGPEHGIPAYTVVNATPFGTPPVDGLFASEWAEVGFFLAPTLDGTGTQLKTSQAASGRPLFTLMRKQRLLIHPDSSAGANVVVDPGNSPEIETGGYVLTSPPTGNFALDPKQVVDLGSRMDCSTIRGLYPTALNRPQSFTTLKLPLAAPVTRELNFPSNFIGSDILLTNVLSFEVKAMYKALTGTPHTPTDSSSTTDAPFDVLPAGSLNSTVSPINSRRVFDTWSQAVTSAAKAVDWSDSASVTAPTMSAATPPVATNRQVPLRIRIQQLQIRIRIWDTKAEQTRQITIVQDV